MQPHLLLLQQALSVASHADWDNGAGKEWGSTGEVKWPRTETNHDGDGQQLDVDIFKTLSQPHQA